MKTWVKLHAMVGVKTHVVTAVKITGMSGADSPEFAKLVRSTAAQFKLSKVSADKAYLSRDNVALVDALGGDPFIPFKEGTGVPALDRTGHASRHAELWHRLYHRFQYDRERFRADYHKRSNVETVFHMIKSKFGAAVRSKTEVAQQNEVLFKVLCHNIVVTVQAIHEFGLEPELRGFKSVA
jgi:transposase